MARHKLPAGPGRPKGLPNRKTREIREFTAKFLSSNDYLASAKSRVLLGDAPHLETLWHHYAFGKPKETIQMAGSVPPFVVKLERDADQ